MATVEADTAPPHRRPWYLQLYPQVLAAIAIGIALGRFFPATGAAMKPLGDGFIKLIKMLIAPIIFFTVVHGIAGMEDMKKVGRVGLKALVYFEAVTTLALVVGLVVVNVWRPGAGMNVDPATLDASSVESYARAAQDQSISGFFLHIIPDTVVGAFAEGEIIQVLFFAVLFGFALHALGERGRPLAELVEQGGQIFFKIIGYVMRVAPLGAFGAMAFTIGESTIGALLQLGALMLGFYATCFLFVFVVLGVDRFMSEMRALTNLVGNGVATIVVAKWEGALDEERMRRQLAGGPDAEGDYRPAAVGAG